MLVLLVTAYASHTADAQTFMLPSIGLASGQTARLTVVNNGTTTATETLDILDEMGAILGTNTVSVAPAHLASVDFPATASQMEVHGRIGPLQFPADLQIFDSTTLSTKVLVEHATAPQPASADLTSPTIGVASGQTARLSIVNDSATTQTQSLFIVSGTGEVLANTMVTLVPGEVGFLDLPNAGSRVEVHAVLATPAVQFPADLEVFDTATLRTSARVEKFHGRLVNVDRMGVPAVNTVSGQVARLAVVNDGTTTERETLSIVNAMGDVLATRTMSVAPGRVAMVQVAIGSSRMEVHGTIEPLIFPADLQVFDIRSQRTIALVEDFKVGLPMSGNVTSPSIGLISGQTARLSVVNNGTTTESETLSIVNGLGVTLASRTFSVLPGQSVAIQVRGGRSRLEIHGNISPCIFPADLQILDNTSRQTLSLTELFLPAPP